MSQLQIIKRNGKPVNFDKKKIEQALINAFNETEQGIDYDLIADIAESIEEELVDLELVPTVESVQDMVEMSLMESDRKDVARQYILYRNERSKVRESGIKDNYKMITSDFVSQYKHQPSPMTNLGNFVFYRTYSRWLDNEKRREFWWETARRAVEFNTSLAPTTKEEAEQLYDNVFNLRQFLSGRTFWIGNTDVSRNYALSNFNCSAVVIDSYKMFAEMFYLLLVGAGAGIRVMPEDVAKMPKIRTDVKMINKSYVPVPKRDRIEYTSLMFEDDIAEIVVGDSKEAWMQSLERFFEILTTKQYSKINTIIMNYDNIRPLGERLKTFGGTASGHTALEEIFTKIDKILRKHRDQPAYQLSTVDCLDIANIIGAGVVVGGVRRTSEIGLGSIDDKDFVEAKSNLYTQENGVWKINEDIIHRQMSNNSIFYNSKPTREQLHWQVTQMKVSAEPGFINAEAARKRRDNFNAVNPCGEILLDSQQCCNLTTVNAMAFVQDGKLNKEELLKAQRLSARAGYRMTFLKLELHDWNLKQKRDRLIGCSLTGWQDMVNATGITKDEEAALLRDLRTVAHQAVEDYAKQLGTNAPLLSTTVKPEGTISQMPTVSSGVHYSHSPYFVRRVRVSAKDPVLKVCEELGYPVFPEVGQDSVNPSTKVVEFPVKAPKGRTKYDVSAIEQLENYKMFMENYVDHNCSITVHVRENEWEDVEQWMWDNWDLVVGVSFISLDDSFYELLPYEAITEQEYNERASVMRQFAPSLISKYETIPTEAEDLIDSECTTGSCPIR